MKRYILPATLAFSFGLVALPAAPLSAQAPIIMAASETPTLPSSSTDLPDAPTPTDVANPVADDAPTTPTDRAVAHKYDTVILAGQKAQPLHGSDYFVYGLHDSFNLYAAVGFTASAGYSQLVDSQPHFGSDATAFAKREGAAALRNTIQTMATDAVFSPLFHDDPRYYALGADHNFFVRVAYAASRVVVTRSSRSTHNRINAPLFAGYALAAASNNAYYPDQDRGGKNTARNFGTSIAGAAIGFEVSEFLDDALHIVHIRKD